MAQQKLAKHKKAKLKENFYVKNDFTRVYYFDLEEIENLFKKVGFEVLKLENQYRLIENRKESIFFKKI